MRKPRALAPGDRLAVVAPASPFDREEFDRGVDEIRRLGFEPVYDESVFARQRYVAGVAGGARRGDSRRVARSVDCRRSSPSAAATAARSCCRCSIATRRSRACKPFIGYSDLTAMLTFLTLGCGLVAFHGPMLAGRLGARRRRVRRDSFMRALLPARADGRARAAGARNGSTRARPPAPLLGGTLTQLLASLGTPFAFAPPPGYVLFLDEVGERPYRLDRMVTQLRQTGLLGARVARSSSASCRGATSRRAIRRRGR